MCVILVNFAALLGLNTALKALNIREIGRTAPILKNSKRAHPILDRAFDKHIDDIKPGASVGYNLDVNVPSPGAAGQLDVLKNPNIYAGSSSPSESPNISINPNSDRAILAHEMGHLASQQTDVGRLVASLRSNPKLKTALSAALFTLPGVAAALEAGDDDMDTSLALAALTQVPTIADEAMATRHGLAIMDKAGLRANLGQRGKLAGGLMSYVAAPMLAAASGNTIGNLFDENV